MFNNKTILITGGTGTFGSSLLYFTINNYKPKKVIIFSRDEFKQFHLSEKLKHHKNFKKIRFFLGDIRDYQRLLIAFKNVDYVIHAAALKYVDIAEYNPIEFVKTNILGSQNISLAAIESGVKKVILLSTDKAVNPVNLYGSTKLVAEKLISASNTYTTNGKTKLSVVRYGNVFNSRGSVIPKFQSLKQGNKKLPITDKNMTRFFLTVDNSIKFVINCLNIMQGGEIFIPKCETIKIVDLAKAISKKSKILIVGIRPGEKIHESLISKDESALIIEFKYFYCLISRSNSKKIKKFITNKFGKGKLIKPFDYSSNNNNFLSIQKIERILTKITI